MGLMVAPCVGLIITGNQTVWLRGSQHMVHCHGRGREINLRDYKMINVIIMLCFTGFLLFFL